MYQLLPQGKDLLLKITPQELDLSVTLDCGQSFRFIREEDGSFSGIALGRPLRLNQNPDSITIRDMSEAEFQKAWVSYFDLETDYEALKQSYAEEVTLSRAVAYGGGIRVLRQEKFETLISFIISQNNKIPRIKNSIERLCKRFGTRLPGGGYAFPTAEQLAVAPLSEYAELGLGYRDSYLVDCVERISSGAVSLEAVARMELKEAREALRTIKGVGPKVAECVLLFGFHRTEAFPIDTWMKKVIARYYPNGFPEQYRNTIGIAQQFLFHYIRTCKDAA